MQYFNIFQTFRNSLIKQNITKRKRERERNLETKKNCLWDLTSHNCFVAHTLTIPLSDLHNP